MSRERHESSSARIPGRIMSALSKGVGSFEARRQMHIAERVRQERRLAQEQGHVAEPYPVIEPGPEPHVVYECKDVRYVLEDADRVARHNAVYNQSISRIWEEGPDEDRPRPPRPSRIGPSS